MKNGRFSGNCTSKRWLIVTCGSSDSTWLKSGLAARSSVSASLITTFASRPARASSRLPRSAASSSRNRDAVPAVYGISWMLRPGDTPSIPVSVAICSMWFCTLRVT